MVVLATVLGDWMWWGMLVVPLYSAWLAWGVFSGARGLMGGGPQKQEGEGATAAQGQSKRQAKMEKRGGQRVAYR